MARMTEQQMFQEIADAAAARRTGSVTHWTAAYITDGGSYMICAEPSTTDSGRPRDLIMILPGALENGTRVIPVMITANPELVAYLRSQLD